MEGRRADVRLPVLFMLRNLNVSGNVRWPRVGRGIELASSVRDISPETFPLGTRWHQRWVKGQTALVSASSQRQGMRGFIPGH